MALNVLHSAQQAALTWLQDVVRLHAWRRQHCHGMPHERRVQEVEARHGLVSRLEQHLEPRHALPALVLRVPADGLVKEGACLIGAQDDRAVYGIDVLQADVMAAAAAAEGRALVLAL